MADAQPPVITGTVVIRADCELLPARDDHVHVLIQPQQPVISCVGAMKSGSSRNGSQRGLDPPEHGQVAAQRFPPPRRMAALRFQPARDVDGHIGLRRRSPQHPRRAAAAMAGRWAHPLLTRRLVRQGRYRPGVGAMPASRFSSSRVWRKGKAYCLAIGHISRWQPGSAPWSRSRPSAMAWRSVLLVEARAAGGRPPWRAGREDHIELLIIKLIRLSSSQNSASPTPGYWRLADSNTD